MMHKLCVLNWALAMQLLLQLEHFMGKVEDTFGLTMLTVLVPRELLETVHTVDGIWITGNPVITMKMLV